MTDTRKHLSRRDFLLFTGAAAVGTGISGMLPGAFWLNDAVAAMPASGGYLLVDVKKCQGCLTCMLACALVHEGKESLSLSRIQILQNSFEKYPDDIVIAQCRQCLDPECAKACPEEAIYVDSSNSNIRRVNPQKCVGCGTCLDACPFEPGRAGWNRHDKRAHLCDLCAQTPFWNEDGGSNGKQACVEACPLGAIVYTADIPNQEGDAGYRVNLRGEGWQQMGFPTD